MKIKMGTVIIDLTKNEEDLWNNVQKDNRWAVKKAEKLGVETKEGGDINECYNLYLAMCKQNNLAPETKESIFNAGKLFTAHHEKKLAAFSIMTEKENTVGLHYNASDYELRNTQANVLLYWKTMLAYKHKGFQKFDLGGIDLNAKYRRSNDRFKERWGGEIVEMEQDASLLEFIWWKYFRHFSIARKLKHIAGGLVRKKG